MAVASHLIHWQQNGGCTNIQRGPLRILLQQLQLICCLTSCAGVETNVVCAGKHKQGSLSRKIKAER